MLAMIPVSDLQIIATNLDGSLDPAEWAAGAYLSGDQVSYNGKIYQAVSDTSAEPTTNVDWAYISETNPQKMFNNAVVTQTTATAIDNSIEITIKGSGDHISLLGIEAEAVYINGVKQDLRVPVGDKWEYRTAPIETLTEFYIDVVFRSQVTIRLERQSEPAKLGKLHYGRTFNMGVTRLNGEVEMADFSVVERNSAGYVTDLQQLAYAKDVDFEIKHPLESASHHFNRIVALRGTPMVFIDKALNLITYGRLLQAKWAWPNNKKSDIACYIEGLI